ncbi:MAG: OsmC family protein [Saprospiraceae bacterium]|nr:OsmC family protein [Saprospiraceae bacterium]MCB0626487.1 OsmC family protein [Saprospiraceae bacterium]MCB0680426.1 OsmC family protein [Saprospiraceae bacterium]
MKITFERLDDAFHLQAKNEMGNVVETDGATDIGGSNKAMRPMQLMLVGLGSCSAIDVIHILRRQRQAPDDIKLTVTAEREKDKTPSLFTDIHLHFELFGDLPEKKVARAVELSMDKYCSVARLLEKTARITSSYEIFPSSEKSA